MACRVFVSNLAFTATKDEVRKCFTSAGRVVDIFFPNAKPDEGKNNAGYGFVEMSNPGEAEAALKLNNKPGPFDRPLLVKPAHPAKS